MTGKARRYALTALAGVILAITLWRGALPHLRTDTGDFAAYYTAAWLVSHDSHEMGHVYEDDWFRAQIPRIGIQDNNDIFDTQPPTMSLILLPMAGLRPEIAQRVWMLCDLLFFLGGLMVLAHALRLPMLWGLWAMPICLLTAPAKTELRLGQVYMLLFFLLCLVFWVEARVSVDERSKRIGDTVVGTVLGLAFALKSALLWLWPLLWFQNRRRSARTALAATALLAVASLPWIGWEAWRQYLLRLSLGIEHKRYVTAYQTIVSLWGHLFVYDAQWSPGPVANWPWLARLLTPATLLAAFLLSSRWGRRSGARLEGRLLTLALFSALAVANAPVAGDHHYLLLFPALAVACWWAYRAKPGRAAWEVLALAALLLCAPLPYRSPRLEAGWLALLAYPRVYGAYLLWGWLGWALRREHARTSPVAFISEETEALHQRAVTHAL